MKTTGVLAALAIGATAIGISIAPPAAADPSDFCQQVGSATVCGQGGVNSGGQPAAPGAGPPRRGCLTPYGTYRSCGNRGGG
jgi:hypothetical protein